MEASKEKSDVTSAMWLQETESSERESRGHSAHRPETHTPSAVIGTIAGLTDDGAPLVTWPGALSNTPYHALTQVPIDAGMVGRKCTLLFVGDDDVQPVVLGLLHDHRTQATGYRIVQAEDALILQCGAARIELHDNGRIILQGMSGPVGRRLRSSGAISSRRSSKETLRSAQPDASRSCTTVVVCIVQSSATASGSLPCSVSGRIRG